MIKDLSTALSLLNQYHIYPSKVINVGLDAERLVALHVDCPKVLFNERQEYIQKVLGEGFIVTPMKNQGWIEIKLKK